LRSGADKPRLRGYGGLGRSRYALTPTPASARIFAPLETYGFLYRGAKTPQTFLLYEIKMLDWFGKKPRRPWRG
jgi:hypothetical protein